MRAAWVLACTGGEAAGIALVATAYAATSRGLMPAAAVIVAGSWEGLCLRRLGVALRHWVGATMLVAALGYAGSLGFVPSGPDMAPTPADPPLWLIVPGAALIGMGMGVLMGLAQGLAARRVVPPGRWVVANALGWMPAMVAIFLPATLVTPDFPLSEVALIGAASGAVAGLCLGLVTALALPRAAQPVPPGK
jgi:hypothetical protein